MAGAGPVLAHAQLQGYGLTPMRWAQYSTYLQVYLQALWWHSIPQLLCPLHQADGCGERRRQVQADQVSRQAAQAVEVKVVDGGIPVLVIDVLQRWCSEGGGSKGEPGL